MRTLAQELTLFRGVTMCKIFHEPIKSGLIIPAATLLEILHPKSEGNAYVHAFARNLPSFFGGFAF